MTLINRMNKIENLTEKVKFVLEKYEWARNNDTMLQMLVIAEYFPEKMRHNPDMSAVLVETDILYSIREDHIKRIRALLNQKGLYLPTDEKVRNQRRISQERWENYIRNS